MRFVKKIPTISSFKNFIFYPVMWKAAAVGRLKILKSTLIYLYPILADPPYFTTIVLHWDLPITTFESDTVSIINSCALEIWV